MKPYRSSSDKENCSPISSNCVIWQGPDLSCINLCKGDSVSDVVYKLATQVCDFQNTVSLDQINLNCLLDLCGASEPDMTLVGVLQLIIDGICCTQGQVMTAANTLRLSATYDENTIVLPQCLWYVDPNTGVTVTTLPVSDYAVLTANALCDLKVTIANQSNLISNNSQRISALENTPPYNPPLVTPSCSYGSVVAGVPTEMNILLSELDNEFCSLTTSLGTASQFLSASAQQCDFLSSQNALSQAGTMGSLPNWISSVNTFAQSMQNLWITVCDMRAAVNDIKQSILPDCTQFLLGFIAGADLSRQNVTLTFNANTLIPSGFSNCPTLSTVTISDGDGHTYADTFNLVTESTNPSGITFNVSTAFLNTNLPYTITVTGCIVKDGVTCSKEISQTILPPTTTTTTTTISPSTYYSVYIEGSDLSNATGNTNPSQDGKVFVSYFPEGSLSPTIAEYSAGGYQGNICVNSLYIPTAYYFASDLSSVAASELTNVGACPAL